jgi:drug/metabolite transporter (DMT)-like permease
MLLAPLLCGGVIGSLFVVFGIAANRGLAGERVREVTIVASILAQAVLGVVSLACLWMFVLMGPGTIKRHHIRRWATVAILTAGEADAGYFLFRNGLLREITSSVWSVVLWSTVLALPMLLGLRYLMLLLKRDQKGLTD